MTDVLCKFCHLKGKGRATEAKFWVQPLTKTEDIKWSPTCGRHLALAIRDIHPVEPTGRYEVVEL